MSLIHVFNNTNIPRRCPNNKNVLHGYPFPSRYYDKWALTNKKKEEVGTVEVSVVDLDISWNPEDYNKLLVVPLTSSPLATHLLTSSRAH